MTGCVEALTFGRNSMTGCVPALAFGLGAIFC